MKKAKRVMYRPEDLVGALQDRVHKDVGRSRPAKVARIIERSDVRLTCALSVVRRPSEKGTVVASVSECARKTHGSSDGKPSSRTDTPDNAHRKAKEGARTK